MQTGTELTCPRCDQEARPQRHTLTEVFKWGSFTLFMGDALRAMALEGANPGVAIGAVLIWIVCAGVFYVPLRLVGVIQKASYACGACGFRFFPEKHLQMIISEQEKKKRLLEDAVLAESDKTLPGG